VAVASAEPERRAENAWDGGIEGRMDVLVAVAVVVAVGGGGWREGGRRKRVSFWRGRTAEGEGGGGDEVVMIRCSYMGRIS
jgi:hypothetical protein